MPRPQAAPRRRTPRPFPRPPPCRPLRYLRLPVLAAAARPQANPWPGNNQGHGDRAAGSHVRERFCGTAEKPTVAAKVAAGATSKADAAKPDAGQPKTTETLRVDQERLDQLMNLGGELVINRARFVQIHGRFRDVFDGRNLAYLVDDMTERVHRLGEQVDSPPKRLGRAREIDEINDHLGHLGHSFQSVRNVVQQVHELRTAMFDFDEALHGLTRVSDGIQKGIMGTRMVPIGPLFGRFSASSATSPRPAASRFNWSFRASTPSWTSG